MPAGACKAGHAIVTPKGRPLPQLCGLATCGLAIEPRSVDFGLAVRSGCPIPR